MSLIIKLIFIYSLILIITILISKRFELFDYPNSRKLHAKPIMNTSGVSLYIFLFILTYFEVYSLSNEIKLIIYTGSFIFLIGFIDDRFNLSAKNKLILILIPIIFLISQNLFLDNLGYYESFGLLKLEKFGIIFTVLACCLLINAYNYVDGLDGLLLGIIQIGIIYIYLIINDENTKFFLKILSIPIIINLIFNFLSIKSYYKIFLGNNGSLFLGFIMSFLIINLNINQKIHASYLIWTCWYPVYDLLQVTISRIKSKKKFYFSDTKHFHHYVLSYFNNSHIKSTITLLLLNALIILIGYSVANHLGKLISLILFIILFFMYFFIIDKIIKKKINV
jgi:UDP-GlcNAc:undecaprenyl-phosphate GlcNAc-1-phosphate transferase